MGNYEKHQQVLTFLRQRPFSICFLQKAHSTKTSENHWQNEWGYKILFSHRNSSNRGFYILFKNNFDFEILKYISSDQGRFVIAHTIAKGKKITLVNLYSPNENEPEFLG